MLCPGASQCSAPLAPTLCPSLYMDTSFQQAGQVPFQSCAGPRKGEQAKNPTPLRVERDLLAAFHQELCAQMALPSCPMIGLQLQSATNKKVLLLGTISLASDAGGILRRALSDARSGHEVMYRARWYPFSKSCECDWGHVSTNHWAVLSQSGWILI